MLLIIQINSGCGEINDKLRQRFSCPRLVYHRKLLSRLSLGVKISGNFRRKSTGEKTISNSTLTAKLIYFFRQIAQRIGDIFQLSLCTHRLPICHSLA